MSPSIVLTTIPYDTIRYELAYTFLPLVGSYSNDIMSCEQNTNQTANIASNNCTARANNDKPESQRRRRLLILGSCGMDRLLTVHKFPTPEQKVRTTNYVEGGGGNAANVAHAVALLSHAKSPDLVVQLGSKVGSDALGHKLQDELRQANVSVDHGLFQVVPNTTTSFTTIIVDSTGHTRTCLHTPGSCGEWKWEEVEHEGIIPWQDVCHFHSDARHTNAALYMARQAKQRGIPISLDVEKDRGSDALDELMVLADIIFTNTMQLKDYLRRLTEQWEEKEQLKPLGDAFLCNKSKVSESVALSLVHALEPSTYFVRRYQHIGKQVVITKGQHGSIHVECASIEIVDEECRNQQVEHKVTLEEFDDGNCERETCTYRLEQVFEEHRPASIRTVRVVYQVRAVGILPNTPIVDTTGAGDAFLGGYLAAKLDSTLFPTIVDCLRLGTWVAGHKIQGAGARTTLPTAKERDVKLGLDNPAAVLRGRITAFGDT